MSEESKQNQSDTELDDDNFVPRRRFLTLAGAGLLTIGFGSVAESLVGGLSEPLNQQVESLIFRPQQPVPEFAVS